MKKYFLYKIALFTGVYCNCQVGIGTTKPQGIFHIDAAKNTTIVGTTVNNIGDDFIVNNKGSVGIGTMPGTYNTTNSSGTVVTNDIKLSITSPTAGAIKIVDGTQGVGKVLVSDAQGVGTWQTLPVFKYVQNGSFSPSATINSDNTAAVTKYSNGSITLSKGRWMISAALTIKLNSTNSSTNVNPYWLQLYLSDTTNGITNTKFSYVGNLPNSFGGNMIKTQSDNFNFPGGSTIIDVANDNTPIYLLIQNVNTDPADETKTINWNFDTNNLENYFYAVPTN